MVRSSNVPAAEVVALFRSGKSLRAISAATGLSRQRVRRLVVEAGEPIRQQHAVDLPNDPSWWVEQFDDGWSVEDLARRGGTNQMHVYRHLRAIGVLSPRLQPLERWIAARTVEDGECLRWTRSFSGGRPIAMYGGSQRQSVRRIVWQRTHGPIPERAWVITIPECPHSDCVAISHLRLVNPDMHIAERVEARQFRWGESHGSAKLTESEARSILQQRTANADDLAAQFAVSTSTIHAIWAGRRWAHLDDGS